MIKPLFRQLILLLILSVLQISLQKAFSHIEFSNKSCLLFFDYLLALLELTVDAPAPHQPLSPLRIYLSLFFPFLNEKIYPSSDN